MLLALDFDGVLCNGLAEYFQTSCKAYEKLWSPDDRLRSEAMQQRFYRLRPVIETGWEMPVLLRSLLESVSDEDILTNWGTIRDRIAARENLNPKDAAKTVDGTRDEWIQTDLEGWLDLHEFYQRTISTCKRLLLADLDLAIVTTKEGRFVRSLLQKAGLELDETQIFGKEVGRPKPETLRQLRSTPDRQIWFVEDRLATLRSVQQQPDLDSIELFLADWGYNTQSDRQAANLDPRVHLLSLDCFNANLSKWLA